MHFNEQLSLEKFDFDLAFTGFIPHAMKDSKDIQTNNFLINSHLWTFTLKQWVAYVRKNLKFKFSEILRKNSSFSMGLIFTDDLSISKLNDQWMHKNSSTDVLSFPILDQGTTRIFSQVVELGDIIISIETSIKQAQMHNHSLEDELLWLLSHGFLHLLGWDHQNNDSLDKMLCDQKKLIHESKFSLNR